jgi:signal transduction protein with GAF and PtsI domain
LQHIIVSSRRTPLSVGIKFGSAGFADLAGFGAIVGHVKYFLLRIIELRKAMELAKEELQAKRIENAKSLLDVTRGRKT